MIRAKLPDLKNILLGLLAFRGIGLAVRAFLPLGLPEIWRQTDTLGVALRYWNRWTVEDSGAGYFLPAVLNSGDHRGIMPMEFPIVDILFAPCFALGPQWGKAVALLVWFAITVALTLLNSRIWEKETAAGRKVGPAMLLLPLSGLGADFAGKFMPDYVSVLLVLVGMGMGWSKRRFFAPLFLVFLGLLLKPTSVTVLLLALAHPQPREFFRRAAGWGAVALGLTGIYYTLVNGYIARHQDSDGLFNLVVKAPWRALAEIEIDWLGKILVQRTLFPYGIFLVLGLWGVARFRRKKIDFGGLWTILLLQLLIVCAMAGHHALNHEYYFIGIGVVGALLFWKVYNLELPGMKVFRALLIVGTVIRLLELSHLDLRSIYRSPKLAYWAAQTECGDLKRRHPDLEWDKGQVFRTRYEPSPTLGLCFGERTNSTTNEIGLYWQSEGVPPECEKIDETSALILARCAK